MGHSLTLVLGGARSGKSDYAQSIVDHGEGKVLYVATATASDEEMRARIDSHRARRPGHWDTLEAPIRVGEALLEASSAEWILLDCMTLLVNNILVGFPEPINESEYYSAVDEELDGLLNAISKSQAKWVIVSNEVGLGLVPAYPMGRFFRDALGRVNQSLAQAADTVVLMVAGIPMLVKGESSRPGLY
jgi:adenosylcobinamide kinase / adenosylcobinamide-phosphate guanylyltransferase